jgi:LysR family glycine cleavage system transcriptional activator
VYPPRSDDHAGLQAFRTWILAAARDYAAPAPAGTRATKAKKKAAKPAKKVAKSARRR